MNLENNNINITLTYLDDLTKNTLNYFVQSNLCKFGNITQPPAITDLYIVDQQKIYGTNFLSEMTGSTKFVIVLHFDGEHLEENNNILLLKKPLDTIKLIDLIDKVHKSLKGKHINNTDNSNKLNLIKGVDKNIVNDSQHTHLLNAINEEDEKDIHQRFKAQKFVGSNKDIELESESFDKIFISEEKYLYYHLNKATKLANSNKSNIILKTFSADIIYLFEEKIFLHDMDANKLKLVQTAPLTTDIKILLVNKDKTIVKEKSNRECKNSFIWASAIQASKGRLPNNTDIEKPVILKAWPNYPQLQIFRYAIQITAVWSKYNLSLIETAKQINIPQRYVFTLYLALTSLDYAEIACNHNNEDVQFESDKDNGNKSIFSNILKQLFHR